MPDPPPAASASAASSSGGIAEESGVGTQQPPQPPVPTPSSSKKKEKKAKPPNLSIPAKKPKLTKAERRAQQEAQRAAKAARAGGGGGGGGGKKKGGAGGGGGGGDGKKPAATSSSEGGVGGGGRRGRTSSVGGLEEKKSDVDVEGGSAGGDGGPLDKTFELFSHLPQYRDKRRYDREFSGVSLGSTASSSLPPEVLSLGLRYADGTIRGGNARCRAMLRTFQSVVSNYVPPPDCRDVRADLDHRVLKPSFQHWTTRCRAHSTSMGNAFTFLKLAIANLDREIDLDDAKTQIIETIDAYVQERIDFADKVVSRHASTKIVDGDVILTYGNSEVVDVALRSAKESGKKEFRVIVVDGRPLLEGKILLESLANAGIECTYVLLNSLSYVTMTEVTKVFLGASALMSDGSILSRVGTACVALMASSHNVPVLFCCETYKISNRVQLESITGNELGDPDDVACAECALDRVFKGEFGVSGDDRSTTASAGEGGEPTEESPLKGWKTTPNLRLLNLLYDLTPSEFVSGIVTEMGILPPTSVAVLLREMNPQDNSESAFK